MKNVAIEHQSTLATMQSLIHPAYLNAFLFIIVKISSYCITITVLPNTKDTSILIPPRTLLK